ncbi:MAG TPA: YraN family protein [Candidatus Saccharimonadales bacterium]|nr:YraN family protein [Candidatus Saccharimonadales bacterium]
MHITNPIGKKGEDVAVESLKKQGYQILERNFRKHYGEIDIIAIDKTDKEAILVFVEVKTRTSSQFGTPFEAITPWKMKPLIKTAQLYAASHKNLPEAMRMDAVAVILDNTLELKSLEHLQNISGLS